MPVELCCPRAYETTRRSRRIGFIRMPGGDDCRGKDIWTLHIVGEEKTPDALRNTSDQFFEWEKPAGAPEPAPRPADTKPAAPKPEAAKPAPKRRPLMVVEAVKLMAADTAEGKVHLGTLGQYLKRTAPAFSPQTYGHSGLLDKLRTYDLLTVQQEAGNYWTVRLAPRDEGAPTSA